MNTADIVLIGNGVLALSTALALAEEQPGLRVVVIGQSGRNLAASPAAGAMLGCFGEVTSATLASAAGREKLALNVAASRMWPEWVENLNQGASDEEALRVTRGTYVLLNAKSAGMDDANVRAIKEALRLYDQAIEIVDGRDIPSLNPLEDCRPLEALYIEGEGAVDSSYLLKRLETRVAATSRVTVLNGRVKRLKVASGSVQGVELEDESRIDAPLVLLAAGFQSQGLIDQIPDICRRIPRLFPGAGTAILLQPPDARSRIPCTIRTPNRSFACGLHAVPRQSGAIYVGATNHIRMAPLTGPSIYDVHFLIECAMEQINTDLHFATLERATVGHRPVSIDGFPLIGPTSISGLWFLTGTYREGLNLSPMLARHVAKEMLGQKGLLQNCFYPERKPIVTLTKEAAIKEAASHHMAIAYEHSARFPGGWNAQMQELFETVFMEFYDKIDSDFVIPPEFMPMILFSRNRAETIAFFRNYYASIAHH